MTGRPLAVSGPIADSSGALGMCATRAGTRRTTRRYVAVRVVIGDDNRLVLEGFRRALEGNEDIEIAGAADSGAYLMTLIERRRPDVVALEFGLRDVSGARCLDLIAELYPEIKVVVLSSSARPEVINSALSRGARALIVKNVNPRDIPSALRQ